MTLYDDLATDISDCLFDGDLADTPTEAVVYRPYGGSPRTIRAFVERLPAETYGHAKAPALRVTAINSATVGIASATIDTGKDLIDLAERAGGAAVSRLIHRIIEHNAAVIILEAR